MKMKYSKTNKICRDEYLHTVSCVDEKGGERHASVDMAAGRMEIHGMACTSMYYIEDTRRNRDGTEDSRVEKPGGWLWVGGGGARDLRSCNR
jgi:hypothetical protein